MVEILAYSPATLTFGANKGNKVLQFIDLVEHRDFEEWYIDFQVPIAFLSFVQVGWIIYCPTKEKGNQAFRVKTISTGKTVKGRAYHIGFDTKNYVVELATVIDSDCQTMLTELSSQIDGTHNFTFVSTIASVQSYSVIDQSLYDGLLGIAEKWGGYLDFDNWEVQIKLEVEINRGVELRYGKNIAESEISENWDNVITKMKPIGNNGIVLTPEWLTSSITYDVPYTRIVQFDTDDIDTLRLVATLYLGKYDVPRINYSVKTDCEQNIALNDTVSVIARQFTTTAKVLAYDYAVNFDKIVGVEFGNYRPTVKNTLNSKIIEVEERTIKRVQVKIDDANNSISLISEDLTETNGQLNGLRSDFTVFSGGISATVSELDASLNADIADLKLRSDALELGFNSIITDGVEKVNTKTGFTFNIDGMKMDTTQSDLLISIGWRNNGQDAGIYVDSRSTGENMMTANDDGVKAKILEVSGLVRFQEYEPTAGVKATGVFWIGG